ncbi:hypothetical protein CHK_3083 [Christensenella hongkongensis]|uniref:Uncharacterized protein n=1 Tax=Christensenella hongkongensis TaxID=270498 RepID=A0A0M2NGV6_9FIRM|nr:hypothetical protein CHK_3083 [Christensenella hongkongensis]
MIVEKSLPKAFLLGQGFFGWPAGRIDSYGWTQFPSRIFEASGGEKSGY